MSSTEDLLYLLRVHPLVKLPPKSVIDIGKEIMERDAKIALLEKESDWLARRVSKLHGCVIPEDMNNAVCSGKLPQEVTLDDCTKCWRKQAQKDVSDDKY